MFLGATQQGVAPQPTHPPPLPPTAAVIPFSKNLSGQVPLVVVQKASEHFCLAASSTFPFWYLEGPQVTCSSCIAALIAVRSHYQWAALYCHDQRLPPQRLGGALNHCRLAAAWDSSDNWRGQGPLTAAQSSSLGKDPLRSKLTVAQGSEYQRGQSRVIVGAASHNYKWRTPSPVLRGILCCCKYQRDRCPRLQLRTTITGAGPFRHLEGMSVTCSGVKSSKVAFLHGCWCPLLSLFF